MKIHVYIPSLFWCVFLSMLVCFHSSMWPLCDALDVSTYNTCIILNVCLFCGLFQWFYMLLLFLNLHSLVLNIWCCLLSQYLYKYLCIFCGSVGAWIDCILFSLTRQQSTCYILPNKFTIMNGWLIFNPNLYTYLYSD